MRNNFILAGLVLLSFTAIAEEIHKWRDENGKVHFGDRPPEGAKTEVIEVNPNVYEKPSTEALSQALAANDKVVMYSTTWCGYCKKARKYFIANKIPFEEYDVENTEKGRRDYKKLNAKGVPVILIGKQRLNGFSEASFKRLYQSLKNK